MSKSGVYLHIPFCRSRCSYCDFATDVYKTSDAVDRYVKALVEEISKFEIQNLKSEIEVDTIYFGGGTPSLLNSASVEKVLNAVYKKFSIDGKAEITMEMNPATVSLETLKEYRNLGINRASFGAQTFDDTELKRLGRKHSASDVRETIALLREADFTNVSFDLIAGLPRQTIADWERNLDEALKLKPEHLSLYLLEIHEATPLAEQIKSGRQPLPDEDLAAEMYKMLVEEVEAKNYRQYEISNFCLPEYESHHNSKYWTLDAVFGFGCSAHSFDGKNRRWSNERDTLKYVKAVENNELEQIEDAEVDIEFEYLFLGLRLKKGVDIQAFSERFETDLLLKYDKQINYLQEMELLKIDKGFLKLTEKGFLYSNEVFAMFC